MRKDKSKTQRGVVQGRTQGDVIHRGGTGFQPVEDQRDPPTSSVEIRQRAYLPHWIRNYSVYSVTFRLDDSLPKSVVESWLAERQNTVQTAEQANPRRSGDEATRRQHFFPDKADRFMDAAHGRCWLKDDRIARIVARALERFDGHRYRLLAWCVMPNHVHVVVQPFPGHKLENILHAWKSFTANQANKELGRKGRFWQPEYYDHLIRDEQDLHHSIEYVLSNPGKAGLKDWKWVGHCAELLSANQGLEAHATSKPV